MARRFNGSSDFIVFTLPSVLQSLDAGPMTIAVVASVTSTADGAFVHTRTSGGTNSWWTECSAAVWNYGQGVTAKKVGDLTTSEGWAVYPAHKANGGSALASGRKIILGGSTTVVTAATGLADGTVPGAGGILQVGKWGIANEFLGADIACAAVWDYELSDAEMDALATGYSHWSTTVSPPKWLVHFNQAAPTDAITDDTGNGGGSSAITGTTIVANPAGFFGGTVVTAGAIALSSDAALVAPAVRLARPAAVALSSDATLAAPATRIARPGGATLAADGTLTAAAVRLSAAGPVALVADAALTAAALRIAPGAAAYTAQSDLQAAAYRITAGAAQLAADGVLGVAYQTVPVVAAGPVAFLADGQLAAAGRRLVLAGASLSATGSLTIAPTSRTGTPRRVAVATPRRVAVATPRRG